MTTASIVGMRYRPPAQGILNCLPAGHPLFLLAEPSNPYDENAIQVFVDSQSLRDIPEEDLSAALMGYGTLYSELFDQPSWHLGYIPKAETQRFHPLPETGASAALTFDGKGWPQVELE